ncbi:hypothetical protein HKX48_003444 [Thoreauomyces humboldtii]|nr:hypothetical protein HKX48_003444 [Thoreauomyces humboldtii]
MPTVKAYDVPTDFGVDELEKGTLVPQPAVVSRSQAPSRWTTANFAFCGLRAANPLLQYLIFSQGWGNGFYALLGLAAATPVIGDLSPKQRLLVAFAGVGAARQIFWALWINDTPMTLSSSLNVALFNLLSDTSNTLLSLTSSLYYLGPHQILGTALFTLGSLLETTSEIQRKMFRGSFPGRVVDTGLWRWARHVNYAGYVLWRTGYAVATSNMYALWNPLMHLWDFSVRGIPVLEHYMVLKHKDEWTGYTRRTRYKLIPYIW